MKSVPQRSNWLWRGSQAALAFVLLVVVLFILFHQVIGAEKVLFSNDGPLGAQAAASHQLPGVFKGGWEDLNTLGYAIGGASANITFALLSLVGPVGFAKFYAPFSLLVLGMGAWAFFRQVGLDPKACIIGAVAACLNSSYFSAACWGVASHAITVGMSFFALAAISNRAPKTGWIRLALAGLALGLAVSEGADIGAIFSLVVACFVLYRALAAGGRTAAIKGALHTALVALFAFFMAAQSISVLVSTQIQGIAGMQQDSRTKQERWDWATQWSLPKRETLGFVIPGVFGYRMDTPEGGNYWGAVGRDPSWDRYFEGGKQGPPPQGFMRFSGGGIYAGILVCLVGFWAALQGFRKNSVFEIESRRWIWFWSAVAFISLLLAFGRFAPFYQILYSLPYFSTIRNPTKFGHIVSWAIVVLFAYGVHGLWERYMMHSGEGASGFKAWWARVRGFDRNWTLGCFVAFAVALLGWLIFGSSRKEFVEYLQQVQFDEGTAQLIAAFSSRQVGIWLLFYTAAVVLITLIISGAFSGARARWGALLLGLLVVVDLGRANMPWIVIWNYEEKYASNEILDRLREKPYLRRVAILPGWMQQFVRVADAELLEKLYRIEWAQHHFLFYNIPSLDIIQMPRTPEDLMSFENALQPRQASDVPTLVPRRWELTSTRYLLGPAELLSFLNQQLDPVKQRFSIAERFAIVPKAGVEQPRTLQELTVVPATNGPYALFEFAGALPRANLYSEWQVKTNEQAVLEQLASPQFDPHETVLLSQLPVPGQPTGTNESLGTVEITSYAPKRIVLDAQAKAESILMLTDRFDPNWKVYVDGESKPLLRPNYLMRGVFVEPGRHKVEFRFEPAVNALYVSLAAWVLGVILIAALALISRSSRMKTRVA